MDPLHLLSPAYDDQRLYPHLFLCQRLVTKKSSVQVKMKQRFTISGNLQSNSFLELPSLMFHFRESHLSIVV